MNSSSDETLMLRVRAGEVEKLGILYNRHRDPLFSFFVRMTGSPSLSEDLVHDVFLRMLKYRHTFGEGKAFRTWMYQVARNAQIDWWRKRQHEVPLEAATVDGLRSEHAGPDVALHRQQEVRLLEGALAALSVESREVLVLARVQGLKYEEVGRVLNCGLSAVKMRVHRALKELREEFMRLTGEKL